MTNTPSIILASTSYIRKKMMEQANLSFKTMPPQCDEDELKNHITHLPTLEQALELAKAKAYSISKYEPDTYVIGSDQICDLEGEIISKSKNYQDAFNSLTKLAGKTHKQNNGTCIYLNGECVLEVKDFAELTMKNLSKKQIEEYIELDTPIGCAGSYKFEENGKSIFSEIKGTTDCIQGFAISEVADFFRNL